MSLVGGFLWLANMTRSDIAYASSQLARFLSNPGMPHFKAAVRVLVYLHNTRDQALVFAPACDKGLEVYVDSNWESKFSCSGAYLMYMGCPIHWFSKQQRSVSLSSAEAEYFGAMLAAKECIFMRELLVDLDLPPSGPTTLYTDSASAVSLSLDPVAFKNTKHILRAAEFLRDLVARLVVKLEHIPGTDMVADILTKAVARPIFLRLIKALHGPGQ